MGHGLQRLTRTHRGKLSVVIPEGMTRPVISIVAAKFATKCNSVCAQPLEGIQKSTSIV
jgi:hypothetical protein